MKPELKSAEKSTKINLNVDEETESSVISSTWCRKVILFVAVFAVLAGSILCSLYLGMNLANTQDDKQVWVTFNSDGNTHEPVKEKLRLNEEEVKIERPGVFTMIINYRKNMVVTMLDKELHNSERPVCYVTEHIDVNAIGKPHSTEGESMNVTIQYTNDEVIYRTTGDLVGIETLPSSAQDMCFGSKLLLLERVIKNDVERERRAIWECKDCTKTCHYVCYLWFLCRKECFEDCTDCSFTESKTVASILR